MIERIREAAQRDVSRETYDRLERFVASLVAENSAQNLIGPGSVAELWERHILDGAQLLGVVGEAGRWCDIGSGAGLPGMVIAILSQDQIILNEPRKLRADFLRRAIGELDLRNVVVAQCKVEQLEGRFDFITARAVAKLGKLFGMACHLAHSETKWVLPKGESVKSELDEARVAWQGSFHLVPSLTRPASAIVVAEHVKRRGKR